MLRKLIYLTIPLLYSCTSTSEDKLSKLRVGMRKNEMIEILGDPSGVVYDNTGNQFRYSFFSTGDYLIPSNVFITIKDGRVKSWYSKF